MSRPTAVAVIFVLLIATAARAQSTIADGVDAFMRGDYRRAADILNPIVEQSPRPDAAAAFFLAVMYDTGLGVPADPIRACAFYGNASLPAAASSVSPF